MIVSFNNDGTCCGYHIYMMKGKHALSHNVNDLHMSQHIQRGPPQKV